MFPSAREENCYFEEEMASTFGDEKSADTQLWQWLVSIYLNATFEGNISTKNTSLTVLPRAFTFRVEVQNTRSAWETEENLE